MGYNLKREIFKASIFYLILISAIYSPIIFYNRTLSFAARYPWFTASPPEEIWVFPEIYPNTFNVDPAHPAAFEEPLDVFIGNQIRQGKFPLWNPFIACGTTMIEQFSTRQLFPYQLLQDIFPWSWRDFFLLGRIFFAAIGVFIFLKKLGVSFYPSFCGGLMYGFSGAMTVFLTLTEMSNVGMALPYILLGGELLNRKQNLLTIIFCSLAIVLLIFGGQPETSFYGMLLFISYFSFRIISDRKEKIIIVKKLFFLFLSMILALLISSPFFIPFFIHNKEYYYLHVSGGTMGIETPTPLANFAAILLPELLRWRSMVSSFTINQGWDCLGGYIGVTGIFFIFISLKKNWWGRKVSFFFLYFGLFILLKNMGMPVVSWIGRLPIFDQIWTPRWAGPIWNLSLALSAALGFQALLHTSERQVNKDIGVIRNKLWLFYLLIFAGIFFLTFGNLINPTLKLIFGEQIVILGKLSFKLLTSIRLLFIIMGTLILIKASRYVTFSKLFFVFSFLISVCIFNFQMQLPHIDGPFRSLLSTGDKLVLFSMWQGMMEVSILGLTVLLALCITVKQNIFERGKLIFILSSIIILETSFHVTLGYDEKGRLIKLLLHFIFLVIVIIFSLSPKKITNIQQKIGLCFFIFGMIGVGTIGKDFIPKREEVFKYPIKNFNYDGISRIMGIRGLIFPNLSVAVGIQDLKSIVSLSIKRFQLFQDYCLLAKPQSKYMSLWFTGITDPETEGNISGHLRERYAFYALAGVTNYLSQHYEDIPHTELIQDGAIKNYKNLAVLPRAFIVHKWLLARSPEQSLSWMLSHPNSLDSEAVIEGLDIPPPVVNLKEKPDMKVKFKSYKLHKVIIDVETNNPGLLILTDTYHPDWRVFVNGKRREIFPTDLCFRGIFLNPGKYEVKFIYFPKVFYICSIVSFITLIILVRFALKKSLRY